VREAAAARLRAWRTQQAKDQGVPAYVVLSDKHLDGIAERHPASLTELRACPGIGPAKLDTYGDEILEVLGGLGAEPSGEATDVCSAASPPGGVRPLPHPRISSRDDDGAVGAAEPGGVDEQEAPDQEERDAAPPAGANAS
jgi:ribonuclease D